MKRWYDNWDVICTIFKFSMPTGKIIYTTNTIKSLNSCYKKLNRQRSVFPSSAALIEVLVSFYPPDYEEMEPADPWLSRKSLESLVQYGR